MANQVSRIGWMFPRLFFNAPTLFRGACLCLFRAACLRVCLVVRSFGGARAVASCFQVFVCVFVCVFVFVFVCDFFAVAVRSPSFPPSSSFLLARTSLRRLNFFCSFHHAIHAQEPPKIPRCSQEARGRREGQFH